MALSALRGYSLSSSLSSASEAVDIGIAAEIIDRAPRAATSFPQVYRAYGEVLEEHGLSPSTDTVYYQFLLKLGVVRAPTWGERWDHYLSLRGAPDVSSSQLSYSTSEPATSPVVTRHALPSRPGSSLASVRARVPFLNDASSDLDEAYGPDGASRVSVSLDDVHAAGLRDGTSVDVDQSYETEHEHERGASRSLVGYTPSASVAEGNSLELDAPYRTSTPVARMPLAYSISHVSSSFGLLSLAKPLVDVSADDSDDDAETTLDSAAALELDARANAFYETGLLARCLSTWRASAAWITRTARQIDDVRDVMVVRQALDVWCQRTERVLALPGTADHHRDTWMKKRALERWAERAKTWRKTYLARVAHAYDHRRLMAVFHVWLDAAERQQLLRGKLAVLEQRRDRAASSQAFEAWHKQAVLAPIERDAEAARNHRLMRGTLARWVDETRRNRAATEMDERRIVRNSLQRWVERRREIQALKRKAVTMQQERDEAVLRRSLHIWVMAERGSLLVHVRETRLLRHALGGWQAKRAAVAALDGKADAFLAASDAKRLHTTFSRWRDVVGKHQNAALHAALLAESHAKTRAVRKWAQSAARARAGEAAADQARAFFLLRSAVGAWKVRKLKAEQGRWLADKQRRDLRRSFDAWRQALTQRQRENTMVEEFQASCDHRTLGRVLSKWTERVVDVKSRELDVAEQRGRTVLADGLARWRRATKKHFEREALMCSFKDVKAEDTLRRVFVHWTQRAQSSRRLHAALDAFTAARDQRLVASAFEQWHAAHRLLELAPIAREVAARHEDALLFTAFDTWRDKCPRVAAIRHDNVRVKRAVLELWRGRVEAKKRAEAARRELDYRLLRDILGVWRNKTREKIASKPVRRGRVRPSVERGDAPVPRVHGTRHVTPPVARTPATLPACRSPPGIGTDNRSHVPRLNQDHPRHPGQPRQSGSKSVASEPAYERLRGEMRWRAGSVEPAPDGEEVAAVRLGAARSERRTSLVGALRRNLH
ncbi:hypothetical protein Q5752_006946 [Cryptotrichosporon argae]